ncbi:trypsin-1-like isoform X2 [Planococcus citri]|uniref:trypsin-1-like isoform X2 n=1 Tax=Planococcus citri TaxID=170843 RepID=UPI0031F8AA88
MVKLSFALVLVYVSVSSQQAFNPVIEVPVDKGLTEYISWWESIFGVSNTEEPEPAPTPIDPKTCPACECGGVRQTRIVGGSTVKYVNQYPWIAQLHYKGKFYCGGSLINSKYILTAAHCVHHFDKKHITVRLLEHDRSVDTESKHITRKVERIVKHKNYNSGTFNNDIALIKMDQDVKLGKSADYPSPVCLPTEGKSFSGMDGIVVGWGATKAGGSSSQVLQEVSVPIITNDECKKTGYGEKRITPNMMCAGHAEGGKDSCQGDSGGPLKIANSSSYYVVGVVSWGEGCAEKNYPGVYTRVNRYLNWLNNNTADACPCPYKPSSYE